MFLRGHASLTTLCPLIDISPSCGYSADFYNSKILALTVFSSDGSYDGFQYGDVNLIGYGILFHQSIHGGSNGQANYPYYVEMRAHLGSLTAYVIDQLRTQGILDSTVVVEVTDMGHADLHNSDDAPMLIAGGGSHVNRGVSTAGSGYNQRDMLHTAASACGVNLPYGRVIPGVLS